MKKLLLVVLALMLVSSVSFAQGANKEAPSPAKEIAKGVESVGDFIGKVVSVTVVLKHYKRVAYVCHQVFAIYSTKI